MCTYHIPFSPPTSVTAVWSTERYYTCDIPVAELQRSRGADTTFAALQHASQHNCSSPGATSYLLLFYSIPLGNHNSLGVPHICTLQCSVRLRTNTAPLEHLLLYSMYTSHPQLLQSFTHLLLYSMYTSHAHICCSTACIPHIHYSFRVSHICCSTAYITVQPRPDSLELYTH